MKKVFIKFSPAVFALALCNSTWASSDANSYYSPTLFTGGGCPIAAVFGATPELVAIQVVAANNNITGSCGGKCSNPAELISVSEDSFVLHSLCVDTYHTHTIGKTINPKQPNTCPVIGNPINPGTGAKVQSEQDYSPGALSGVRLIRYYNSKMISSGSDPFGAVWRHNYQRSIVLITTPKLGNVVIPQPIANVWRADGRILTFTLINNQWTPDLDISETLVQLKDAANNPTGWRYTNAEDEVETYDVSGKLLTLTNRQGQTQMLTYDGSGRVSRVTDAFNRALTFTYDTSSRIVDLADPANGHYRYSYDLDNNLISVIYPGQSISRTYLYNESSYTAAANFPHALTGIADENGNRFATWNYDLQGRAVSSEHAGGTDKNSIAYNVDGTNNPTNSIVIDPLGAQRTFTFQVVLGVVKGGTLSQPGGSGCGAASSAVTYDANGNVSSRTDFNGVQATYQYDLTRNLETQRVEAFGTPQARTISTAWHATYRLPISIAEPKRITTFSYDSNGNLLTKTIRATTDATGTQGMSATTIGTPRIWSYTYNSVGQVLTATGPRTDVIDKTSYTYDDSGNLIAITNALGHITTLSNYDANGRVGKITDPNGTVTDLTYSPRGWLLSKVVTGAGGVPETTSYDYDGVGQLIKVTQPDSSTINYTYDPAHRLTNISDSLGNSIAYTLDAMGNRTNEQIKDPTGQLARQITRVYDALNRLQTVTGAVQ